MTNLDSVLKSRNITLPTNVHIVKAMVFPLVMYWREGWTINKAEHQRIDAFELWCWKSLESPLDSKEIKPVNPKGNQPWIFIGRTDAEAEALIWRANSMEKTRSWKRLRGGREGGSRGWDGWMASLIQWTRVWANSERLKDREAWHAVVQGGSQRVGFNNSNTGSRQ